MFSTRIKRLSCVLALGASAIVVQPAAAQSTIFNIPTTDTVAPKKTYFEFDYLMQAPAPDLGKFQIFAPRVVFGVTPQVEVGANVAVAHYSDGGGNLTLFQPDAKYKFYADDDKGLAASAGFIAYFANNNGDNFGQIYANVSKKMKSGMRVTAGGYGAVSCDACNGGKNKAGVILGLEKPINAKVSFVADFLSGKNFWGYFTPGISVVLPHNGLLNLGYSLGNDSYASPHNDNRALFIYYGATFP